MESEAARRRLHMIACHFAAKDDISATTHLLPMSCSSSLNNAMPRCDNRMYFARQGSSSQACFMRQVSNEQCYKSSLNEVMPSTPRYDNKLNFSRQSSDSQGCFMRQISDVQGICAQSGAQVKHLEGSSSESPLLLSNSAHFTAVGPCKSKAHDCKLTMLEAPPDYARPSRKAGTQKPFHCKENLYLSESNDSDSSPRMDVAESENKYVMMIDIPGVNIDDIRVEVDDQNLTVNAIHSKRMATVYFTGSTSRKYGREVFPGPYKLVWPLPSNVNKDHVSAEFWNGMLQIIIPKL